MTPDRAQKEARQGVGYSRAMQAMHWGTVALLLCVYPAAWMIDGAANPADKAWFMMLHRSVGATILLLTAIRLAVRQGTRVPPLPAATPMIQRLAARATVVALYTLLILQPVLGVTAGMLHGDRSVLFGRFVLPPLLPVNKALAHQVFQVHGWVALMLLALIGLHVAAALYHHFVLKDEVLAGMLPGAERLSGSADISPERLPPERLPPGRLPPLGRSRS